MENILIRELTAHEIEGLYPFIQILNPKTEKEILEKRIVEMRQYPYRCLGLFIGNKLVGICGFWVLHKFYVGKHIEPDNVLILPEYRNKQLGEQLLNYLHNWAIENGCVASELNVYTNNSAGIKFWINQGYRILGFHMQKRLDSK